MFVTKLDIYAGYMLECSIGVKTELYYIQQYIGCESPGVGSRYFIFDLSIYR